MKDYRRLDQYDVININLAIRHKTGFTPALKLLDARASWSMVHKPVKGGQFKSVGGGQFHRILHNESILQGIWDWSEIRTVSAIYGKFLA